MARILAKLLGMLPWRADPRDFLLKLLPKHSVGAEIGVHRGDFSARILRIVRPRQLHLIDPWKHETSDTYKNAWYGGAARGGQIEMDGRHQAVHRRFAHRIRSGQVSIHRGYSGDILNEFPDGHFDWIYIDGNHLYEFVKKDLELSLQKTKPGGHIAGDDYPQEGWWLGGVKKAVDEFILRNPVQLVTLQNGQFLLRK